MIVFRHGNTAGFATERGLTCPARAALELCAATRIVEAVSPLLMAYSMKHSSRLLLVALALSATLVAGSGVGAQSLPGKIDLEAAEAQAAHLIGWPVIAGGSGEIGEVADVALGEDGRPAKIRIRMPSPLGFGERIVEIPASAFTVLRDTVVLDLTAEDVDQFPTTEMVSDQREE